MDFSKRYLTEIGHPRDSPIGDGLTPVILIWSATIGLETFLQ
jgi:hypothetical protein